MRRLRESWTVISKNQIIEKETIHHKVTLGCKIMRMKLSEVETICRHAKLQCSGHYLNVVLRAK